MSSPSHLKSENTDSNSSSITGVVSAATTNTKATGGDAETLKSIKNIETIKSFVFTSDGSSAIGNDRPTTSTKAKLLDRLEIKIPELLKGDYSFYTWPCAPILAHFLWEHRHSLVGKRILELGAGTGLPGILAAKCGAHVIISDDIKSPKSLAHLQRSCVLNNLEVGRDAKVIGIGFGLLLNSAFCLGPLDLIIASDCFYDPIHFEDIITTVSFLLQRNKKAKFIFTYQERSADWSIESLLTKWRLIAVPLLMNSIGKSSGLSLADIAGNHTIHLIQITRNY